MNITKRSAVMIGGLLASFAAQVSGAISIDDWRLTSVIHDFAPGAADVQEFVAFETVQNPFQEAHEVELGLSSVTTDYDIGWLLGDAHFDITTAHHLAQLDGETITSGRIYLSPATDSIVTFTGNWQYAWPSAAIGNTHVSVQLGDLDDEVSVLSVTASGGNFGIGPPFGSFTFNQAGLLLANHHYLLFYTAQVHHFDPTPPSTFGEASGDFHFLITPIPEPATALLIATPIPFRRRRARCRD